MWFGPDGLAGTLDDVTLPTIVTGADGAYLFPNLPDGSYSVSVGDGLPNGLDTNTFDADADGANPPDGTSIVTDLGVGVAGPVADLDQDFGYAGTGTIGDTIWLDLDGDGMQDAGEPGIAEAQVTLTWFGPDGLEGTADDVVFPTQITGPTAPTCSSTFPQAPSSLTLPTSTTTCHRRPIPTAGTIRRPNSC